MSAQTVDLPTTSTVGGKLIMTEDNLVNSIVISSISVGVILLFIITFMYYIMKKNIYYQEMQLMKLFKLYKRQVTFR